MQWLNEEKLIERVLSLFSPPEGGGIEEDSEAAFKVGEQHDNAGQLLVEIIRSCRDCPPVALTFAAPPSSATAALPFGRHSGADVAGAASGKCAALVALAAEPGHQ